MKCFESARPLLVLDRVKCPSQTGCCLVCMKKTMSIQEFFLLSGLALFSLLPVLEELSEALRQFPFRSGLMILQNHRARFSDPAEYEHPTA